MNKCTIDPTWIAEKVLGTHLIAEFTFFFFLFFCVFAVSALYLFGVFYGWGYDNGKTEKELKSPVE